MLIDTHCHLHDKEFFTAEQAEEIIKRAHQNGVEKIVCIGTSHKDSLAARDFASKHNNVYWTYGIHPEETGVKNVPTGGFWSAAARDLAPSARGDGPDGRDPSGDVLTPIAIGEVGLDYHSEGYDREAQIRLFEEMLQLATDNDLPLSFHVRNAFDDFFPVVANFPSVRGVVHSFTDNKKTLKKILENTDFYVGVNGLATYTTLPTPPLERILLETDAPFLTPAPFRGIINESGYILQIAEWLSNKLEVDLATIERITTENAEKLFKFKDADEKRPKSL